MLSVLATAPARLLLEKKIVLKEKVVLEEKVVRLSPDRRVLLWWWL